MCGFFGVVNFNTKLSTEDIIDIKNGTNRINYRGPDNQKFLSEDNFCFGFNRLSIIDLKADSQPYTAQNKSVIMMCNGEIYNYKHLRKILISKGYKFKNNTDVEVILHGYIEWGVDLWNKLNGIFSIVILDKKLKKIFLIRDQLGVKPLHYFIKGEKIYIGSDYNSFLQIKNCKHSINKSALNSYLSFRYVIGKQSFYKNIFDVLPGHENIFDGKTINQREYWDIPTNIRSDQSLDYCLEKLDYLLNQSVKNQLISDVPLGAFISGGLDSSLLLSYMKKYKPDLKTFISGFKEEGYNEYLYAEKVTKFLQLKQPYRLDIKENEYIDLMKETIDYRGEPISVPHENAFLQMSRFMKKDISVVMSGEGADELFGGYGRIFRSPHDYYLSKKPFVKNFAIFSNLPEKKIYFASPMKHFLARYSWFSKDEKKSLLKDNLMENEFDENSLQYVESLFKKVSHLNYYEGMYYLLGKLHLTNLLNRLDRMTMASSVEARVPFLDVKLVEFVSTIPVKYKLRWKNSFSKILSVFKTSETISENLDIPKYILKKLAEKKIPRSIIYRKKMGFPVPLNTWATKKFGGYAYDILTSSKSKTKELFNLSFVEKFIKKRTYDSKEDMEGKKIWMLLNIELWLQDKNL